MPGEYLLAISVIIPLFRGEPTVQHELLLGTRDEHFHEVEGLTTVLHAFAG